MIHKPSSLTARMKEFRICPIGFSVANAGAKALSSYASGIGATQPLSGMIKRAAARETAALASTAMPPSKRKRSATGAGKGAVKANPAAEEGSYKDFQAAPPA